MNSPLYKDADGNYARAVEFLEEVKPELARQLTSERLAMIQILYATRDDAYHCGYQDGFTFNSRLAEEHLPAALSIVKQCRNYKPRIAELEPETTVQKGKRR